jgi:hypothetical protein
MLQLEWLSGSYQYEHISRLIKLSMLTLMLTIACGNLANFDLV